MASRKYSHLLLNMPKVAAARERRQGLTSDETKLLYRDNNNYKVKHDYLKKLSTLDI